MSKKFDTSWFNLKNYEKLGDLDLYGWYQQLVIRNRIKSVLLSYDDIIDIEGEDLNDYEKSEIEAAVYDREWLVPSGEWEDLYAGPAFRCIERIKNNPIFVSEENSDYTLHESDLKYPFNTYSVTSTPADVMHSLGTMHELSHVWHYCSLFYQGLENAENQDEFIKTPYDLLCINEGILEYKGLANITVDLIASDDQIKKDFSHWLSKYRKAIKFSSKKRIFTNDELKVWNRERLLPYLDLKLIARFEGKRIYNAEIAKLIYKDKPTVDFTESVRRTIKRKAEKLIRQKTLAAIELQLYSKLPKRSL